MKIKSSNVCHQAHLVCELEANLTSIFRSSCFSEKVAIQELPPWQQKWQPSSQKLISTCPRDHTPVYTNLKEICALVRSLSCFLEKNHCQIAMAMDGGNIAIALQTKSQSGIH